MPTYRAPLRDIRFVLHELVGSEKLNALPGYEDATPDVFDAVLEEAAKLCEEVLFPLNQSGDAEGCTFENGEVRTPIGFKDAWNTFVAGGWTGLASSPEWGGQGLPLTLRYVLDEMICSSNISFGMFPGLSHGAYVALTNHGDDELKRTYLPRLVDGTWTGTMCLTEAHAGTDLGIITTRAEPAGDGAYRITGSKIFITAGEHDLTENIIHLVLARLPDAPEGTRGISMFVVPKFLPTEDGKPGTRNAVSCGSIEHKMGIKASPTCVINFDGATGFLVGEPHKGMRAMFTMMNEERLAVGMQGLGLAEVAYQNAVEYARERLQGRAPGGPVAPDKPADPIINHPDVRRNLLLVRSFTESARALSGWVGSLQDISRRHPDEARRQEAEDLVALMTPIVKAHFTDLGFECTNHALQVFGGHGYVREFGVEQYVRDARIGMIYEGTNGVQALDLIGRKLPMEGGRLVKRYFGVLGALVAATAGDERIKDISDAMERANARLQQVTMFLAQRGMQNPAEAAAAATDYQRLFGTVVLGHMWLWMAQVASAKLASGAGDDAAFYETKLRTARFYATRVLPQATALGHMIQSGGAAINEYEPEMF
jgi:alkylation response protein AidB-like acyl-CoA dehydrogenase